MNTPNFLDYIYNFPNDPYCVVKNAVMIPVIVMNDDIYLLTTLEKRTNQHHKWGFPGGKIDYGENVLEACFREFYEETNYPISLNEMNILATFKKRKTFFMAVELLVEIPKFIENNEILDLCYIPWDDFLEALYITDTITCGSYTYGLRRCMKTLKY
jgi:8-oxo-dGTP pyrophosphatase MutT (NUDIX family)